MMKITVRTATAADAALLYRFIRELATYEREPDAVTTTPERLTEQLSQERPPFECLIAEADGVPAGFALFFHNYSTWRGRAGLYLEDLFVSERLRGSGIGRRLFEALGRLAVERGCARLEFAVLDWNQPAIDFYRSRGARPMRGWSLWRLDGAALEALARGR